MPSHENYDSPNSEIFIKTAKGSTDWEPGPSQLPKMTGGPNNRDILSAGHGSVLLTSPIRVQLGAQDENNQHSGSGLIHVMFSHNRPSLQSVHDLIHGLLFPAAKIKALYKTKAIEHGHYRYIVLCGGTVNEPFQIVLEGRVGYLRLITVYKAEGNISAYNKFKSKPNEYLRLYSAKTTLY